MELPLLRAPCTQCPGWNLSRAGVVPQEVNVLPHGLVDLVVIGYAGREVSVHSCSEHVNSACFGFEIAVSEDVEQHTLNLVG